MKPEHLTEAAKLVNDLRVLKKQHTALSDANELHVQFFGRQMIMTKDDLNYDEVKSSMMTLLNLRIANIYHRTNQIGLDLQPVVIPEPVAVKQEFDHRRRFEDDDWAASETQQYVG
jgi:ribosome-interacting GTPase 1